MKRRFFLLLLLAIVCWPAFPQQVDMSLFHGMKLEYQRQGVRLGWLIDPVDQASWIYRAGDTTSQQSDFLSVLSGEDVLPGFELRVTDFWETEE